LRSITPLTTDTLEAIDASLNYKIRRTDVAVTIRDDLHHITFEESAWLASFRNIPTRRFRGAEFSAEVKSSMIWLYENAFGKRAAEILREEILALGLRGCPYCHMSNAPTLDHMYPKATHPRLAVTPRNLVPCCRDCNDERGKRANSIDLDPYADTWAETETWMTATVVDIADPALLRYSVSPPSAWSKRQANRVADLFTNAQFASRFRIAASQEMYGRAEDLLGVFNSGGLDALRASLTRELQVANTRSRNHWAAVAYAAWIDSIPHIDWAAALHSYIPNTSSSCI